MNTEIFNYVKGLCLPEKMANKFNSRFKNTQDKYDYIQEMYLILLEVPDDKLQGLYERKELPNYFSQICLNQITNHHSKFNKKYQTYNTNIISLDKPDINSDNDSDYGDTKYDSNYRSEDFYETFDEY